MRTSSVLASAAIVSLATWIPGGCSSNQKDAAGPMPEGVKHSGSASDRQDTNSPEPITGSEAVLYVNGLGCPLCATNIDKQLERLPGVSTVAVDLSAGKVTLGLGGKGRPTPRQITEAVTDAGFTLVRIEQR